MFRPQDGQYYLYLCYCHKPILKFSIVTGGGSSVSIDTAIGMETYLHLQSFHITILSSPSLP